MRNRMIMMPVALSLAVQTAWAAPRHDASAAANAPLTQRVDHIIDAAIGEKRIVGTVVVVLRDGKVIYHRAAGLADRESNRPMREDTVFRLASMSKAIVSASALKLIDEGKLRLNDPVTRWIPSFRPKLKDGRTPAITVRELLSHTAGLNYGFFEPLNGPYHKLGVSDGLDNPGISLNENLRRISSAPLLYQPGTAWNYSLSIDVLGAVVSKVGGSDLPSVVRRTVTGPLGMKDTDFFARSPQRLATPYSDAKPEPHRMSDPERFPFGGSAVVYSPSRATNRTAFPSGGAGMVGTAADYVTFLETIRKGGGKILSSKSDWAMTHNQVGNILVTAAGKGWGWGLGFAVLKDPTPTHSPLTPGSWQWGGAYGSSYWVDPKEKLTVVALTNTAVEGMSGQFAQDVKRAVYGR